MTAPDIPAEKRSAGARRGGTGRGRHGGRAGDGLDGGRVRPCAGPAAPLDHLRGHVAGHGGARGRPRPRRAAVLRHHRLDLAIDGADQVDPAGWLVKGGGGAHTRERIVAAAADRFVVIVSSDKTVERLHPPVPLELLAFGLAATLHALPGAARRDAPPTPDGGVLADYHGDVADPGAAGPVARRGPGPCLPRPVPAVHGHAPSSWRGATRCRCVRSAEPSGWGPVRAWGSGRAR